MAMKEATEENEDWNKAVEEATTAEDKFNLALESCSNEQERQQLITKTLTKYYSKAASTYKKTNKAVIEANEANEEWNATMAELGEEMQPAVTEVKKFGTSLLKEAKQPLKEAADFITNKFIPAVEDISDWVKNNGPTIKGTIAGITTAWLAYKTATMTVTLAEKGLKDAIMATTVAQKALDLVQKASPLGLIATALAAVVAAYAVYKTKTEEAARSVTSLTTEEKNLMAAANEAADAFRDQKKATTENESGIMAQMGKVNELATELQTLADKSGAVKDADKARVDFILGELNEALGTEYTMTDGVIQKYDELQQSINEVIQAKTANNLLEANNADYITALTEKENALQNVTLAEKDYTNAVRDYEEYYAYTYWPKMQELEQKLDEAKEKGNTRQQDRIRAQMGMLQGALNNEKGIVTEKKKAWDKASANYGMYSQQIMEYEEAQQAVLEGNYGQAIELLTDKGASFFEYSKDVDKATQEAINKLYGEAVDAGLAAARTKENFEKGVDGYTEEMVKEAEQGYEDALNEWATAYADAEGVGEDLGDGLSGGLESKKFGLLTKARSIVSGIISAMREAADSNSPSKETISLGEDMGEGGIIGLENKTDDMLKVAEDQVDGLLGVYAKAGDATGQSTLNAIRGRDTALQNSRQPATGDKLDAILEAIKAGQIIALDGDKMVGGTADRMNRRLGQLQLLTERGAL